MATEFIKGAGAAIASKLVLSQQSPLKWAVRENPIEPPDTGWRFFALDDTDETLNDPANMQVVDYNAVCEIEPAVIGIYNLPVGSDLQIIQEGPGTPIRFLDNHTDEFLDPSTFR
ncbi:hypothetical protein B0O41_4203 [Propionibacteriaceae bacterium ES.041]|uniref:DUF2185 domain-containing protein n=1 Tax=Enemella evansiae TaxID=2016499 RepID=UPI000B960AC8|nr:DUF2185 domain-containing protein [Enemella evansiae]OYO02913.1 hypothetical protein CGZ96_01780 [Enemella evansiae]PFG69347.1 hypothetical protein B0O41_4203 [Propionibacteriaceae bacterium ES.041]